MLALLLDLNLVVCSNCCRLLNDVEEVAAGLIFLYGRIYADESRALSAHIGIFTDIIIYDI